MRLRKHLEVKKGKKFQPTSVSIKGFVLAIYCIFSGASLFAWEMCVPRQIESQIILLKKKREGILIDAGSWRYTEANRKWLSGIRLQSLLLSHMHPDHASGVIALTDRFIKMKVYLSEHHPPSTDNHLFTERQLRGWRQKIENERRIELLRLGSEFSWNKAQVKVLWPSIVNQNSHDLNFYSLVLLVKLPTGHRILLMGDATQRVEQEILENLKAQGQSLQVDVLVVGHHAANDSTSEEWLKAVNPRYSLVISGGPNVWGYPNSETMQRIKKYSQEVILLEGEPKQNSKAEGICFLFQVAKQIKVSSF